MNIGVFVMSDINKIQKLIDELEGERKTMACKKCGFPTWSDDDLHWLWCKNPKCTEFYGNDEERMREFFADIARNKESID